MAGKLWSEPSLKIHVEVQENRVSVNVLPFAARQGVTF